MSTRVTINIGFYFQKQHYAQLQGYIPRREALSIPDLQIEELQKTKRLEPEPNTYKGRQAKSESKKQSEDDSEEDDNNAGNEMEMEMENEIDNEMENEDNEDNEENEDENEIEMDADQQSEIDHALKEMEEENENYDSDESSDDDEEEEEDIEDISELSNQSPIKGYNNNKTKRQKGETKDLVQLPDRRPRKDKKLDQATEIIRREEKERKRKQYLKKQVEAQEKATLEKILNETGRKLRMREEKEIQDEIDREQKVYKSLGNVPKIITLINEDGRTIFTHRSTLFPAFMTASHDTKMREICTNCGSTSRYTLKGGCRFACSLPCYKAVVGQ